MLNVVIKDVDFEQNYFIKLNEDQYRLLEWLKSKVLLTNVEIEMFKDFEEI